MIVPRLETGRLLLRGLRLEDFAAYAARWARPEMYRFGGQLIAEEDAWVRFLRGIGHWSLMGFGYWCIEERATGLPIGDAGLQEARRDIVPSLIGIPEAGWAISPEAQGKGYATEAVLAIVQWADKQFGAARTACMIHPQNTPSIRVAQKCGYVEQVRTTHKGNPTTIFYRN